MSDWEGKVAVITGAGSGIGEALAHRFADEGMKIVVSDIDLAAARRVAGDLAAKDYVARAQRTDVASQDSVNDLADMAWSSFGSVDILCNNAGVVPAGRFRPVWEYPLEDWRWALDVNMMGVVHGIRAFIPRMIAQGSRAHVVTTASVAGLVSGSGSPVYSAAKHGAVRVTEALYASLKEMDLPIGVTLLCPGLVNTNIYRSERNRPKELVPGTGISDETPELQAIADDLYKHAISPEQVAEMLFAAIEARQFYLLTSVNFDESIRRHAEAILSRTNPEFDGLMALSKADAEGAGT